MSFCGSPLRGLGSHVSPTSSHLPREKVQDEISLALNCVPWGRGGASQGKLHLARSQHIQLTVWGSKGGLKLLFWKPGLLKGSLVCG